MKLNSLTLTGKVHAFLRSQPNFASTKSEIAAALAPEFPGVNLVDRLHDWAKGPGRIEKSKVDGTWQWRIPQDLWPHQPAAAEHVVTLKAKRPRKQRVDMSPDIKERIATAVASDMLLEGPGLPSREQVVKAASTLGLLEDQLPSQPEQAIKQQFKKAWESQVEGLMKPAEVVKEYLPPPPPSELPTLSLLQALFTPERIAAFVAFVSGLKAPTNTSVSVPPSPPTPPTSTTPKVPPLRVLVVGLKDGQQRDFEVRPVINNARKNNALFLRFHPYDKQVQQLPASIDIVVATRAVSHKLTMRLQSLYGRDKVLLTNGSMGEMEQEVITRVAARLK